MNKQTALNKWLKDRPAIVKQLAKQCPPWQEFELKGQEGLGVYTPLAYSEDGTIRCNKRDWLGIEYQVFGMKPEDLIRKKGKK